jgi:hypothetical protein
LEEDDELFSIEEKEDEDRELDPEEAIEFIEKVNTEERIANRQKKERVKALLKGKDALLKQAEKDDDDDNKSIYSVHTNASKKSSASKLREQRDVLKKIGEKISVAEPKVTNTIENQLMK